MPSSSPIDTRHPTWPPDCIRNPRGQSSSPGCAHHRGPLTRRRIPPTPGGGGGVRVLLCPRTPSRHSALDCPACPHPPGMHPARRRKPTARARGLTAFSVNQLHCPVLAFAGEFSPQVILRFLRAGALELFDLHTSAIWPRSLHGSARPQQLAWWHSQPASPAPARLRSPSTPPAH